VPGHQDPAGRQPALSAPDARRVPSSDGIALSVHALPTETPLVRLAGATATPSPPTLLAVHATGFHGRVWSPFARHLPWRCWAPDLRGHGASPLPPSSAADIAQDQAPVDWERFADDVLAVADDLIGTGDAEAGHLLGAGHSMGGAALLLAEARRPGTFAALYVFEPIVFPPGVSGDGPASSLARGARRRRRQFGSRSEARANYAAKAPLDALDPDALDAYVAGGFVADEDGSVILACEPEIEAAVFEQGFRHRAFERLGAVRCPVTVACGRPDPGPARLAPAVAAGLPNAELVTHGRLGHFGPLEDPAAIAADCIVHLGRW
jgi:pimeloyl-ACP methyl ester carboxylesterase